MLAAALAQPLRSCEPRLLGTPGYEGACTQGSPRGVVSAASVEAGGATEMTAGATVAVNRSATGRAGKAQQPGRLCVALWVLNARHPTAPEPSARGTRLMAL